MAGVFPDPPYYITTRLSDYLRLGFISTVDLVLGTGIAKLADWFFADELTGTGTSSLGEIARKAYENYVKGDSIVDDRTLIQLIVKSWLQLMLTVFLSFETRSLLYSQDLEDPLGGMVFIYSVFRQPVFWARVDLALAALAGRFRKIGNVAQGAENQS